ncbi:MAG: glycosyltransferase family 4 protein [Treponema sp.]|nr:glycosyltransferase family 4 protein [Treponema sp.]
MTAILINGNFLCRSLTGIERFAWEVTRQLDALLTDTDDVRILIPVNAPHFPEYKRIQPVISEKPLKSFPLWDMHTVPRYAKKLGAVALNFSNTAPLGKQCGISFIHDIYAYDCPGDFSSFKEKLIGAYSRMHYKNIARNARHIVTVSNFSKERIQSAYNVSEDRISVIGNGWDHFTAVTEDTGIFDRFPELSNTPFYFTLGSLSLRKNLAWIASYAATHADEHFAVSGKAISGGFVPPELAALKALPNVTLVGYVTDSEVKALMKACRAFVFPSYYEGFGIPPLEALSVGAQVVVADEASLPEIYGSAAHYLHADVMSAATESLTDRLSEPVTDAAPVLAQYTYRNAAEKLYELIQAQEKNV